MAIRDLSRMPRAEVDALRKVIMDGFNPGGDFDACLTAQRRLREIVDAQPVCSVDQRTVSWLKPGRRVGGRRKGSKVVNGRVVPPPVAVDVTQSRVVMDPLPPAVEAKLLADEDSIRDWWRARGF